MATSATNLHSKEKREKEAAWSTDMGFILPLFPGDIRDTESRQLGGPEAPVHLSRFTLPRSVAAFYSDDVSSVVASACAALR
jgi:hypothetical protein